jgi:hypothetical protein
VVVRSDFIMLSPFEASSSDCLHSGKRSRLAESAIESEGISPIWALAAKLGDQLGNDAPGHHLPLVGAKPYVSR